MVEYNQLMSHNMWYSQVFGLVHTNCMWDNNSLQLMYKIFLSLQPFFCSIYGIQNQVINKEKFFKKKKIERMKNSSILKNY